MIKIKRSIKPSNFRTSLIVSSMSLIPFNIFLCCFQLNTKIYKRVLIPSFPSSSLVSFFVHHRLVADYPLLRPFFAAAIVFFHENFTLKYYVYYHPPPTSSSSSFIRKSCLSVFFLRIFYVY